ncbi:MAG: NUMOD3 domain-containing DNA-binding protein [Candidatus Jorgensenbacteria bacterium]
MPKGVYKRGKTINRKPHSEETKRKISLAHKGTKKPWTRNNPQVFKKGLVPWNKGKKGITKYWLGKERSKEDRLKMSLAKIGKAIGGKHWKWKGGISKTNRILHHQIRHSLKYREWRSDVFSRDNFTCQMCSKRGDWLEADHYPEMFSQILEENKIKTLKGSLNYEKLWNINNSRTLCRNCHIKTFSGKPKKPWEKSSR